MRADLFVKKNYCVRKKDNLDRKSTRLNSSHSQISYAVFCLKKKTTQSALPAFQKFVQVSAPDLSIPCNISLTPEAPSVPTFHISIAEAPRCLEPYHCVCLC